MINYDIPNCIRSREEIRQILFVNLKNTLYEKIYSPLFLLLAGCTAGRKVSIDKIINASEIERIETVLSSDDMQGRKTFSPGIDKAADFIAEEFKKAG